MSSYTAEQVRIRDIDRLGPEFGTLFNNIKNDLFALRVQWRIYVALFGTNEQRVDLLNSASGPTAFVVEKALFESTLLGVCRLTDPPDYKSSASKNISISRFPQLVASYPNPDELNLLVRSARERAGFARTWRNKRLAHADDEVREGRAKIDGASRAKVLGALDGIADVVRWIGFACLDETIITHPSSEFSGDEVQFLETLFLGVAAREERGRRLRQHISERRYDQAEALTSDLPIWLTFRPDHTIDK